jgi:hypothetical protein
MSRSYEAMTANLTPTDEVLRRKERVHKHIGWYFEYLHPDGYLTKSGGYWEVPSKSLRLSLNTGESFDMDDEKNRNPKADVISLWRDAKNVGFKQALKDLDKWCDKAEREGKPATEAEEVDSAAIKEVVFKAVFTEYEAGLQRGSARHFWKIVRDALEKEEKGLSKTVKEFSSAPRFLALLQMWAREKDDAFFTVTDKSRKSRFEFELAVPNPQPGKSMARRILDGIAQGDTKGRCFSRR